MQNNVSCNYHHKYNHKLQKSLKPLTNCFINILYELPYFVFDQLHRVDQGEIVTNKRLEAVLKLIKEIAR